MANRVVIDGQETLADIIGERLDVLFVGYNPSLLAVERAHYYPRKTNRFWEDLHEAGLVPRILREPGDDLLLPAFGLGVTDIIKRPSANSDGLTSAEYAQGFQRLADLVATHKPLVVCFNGLGILERWRKTGLTLAAEIHAVPSTSPRNQGLRVQRLEAFRTLAARVATLRQDAGM